MEENGQDKRSGDKGKPAEIAWWQPAVLMFMRLSGWIVAPVLLGAFLGKWLDNTKPWLFIASVGAAFIISMVGLVRNVTKEYNRIEKETADRLKKTKPPKNNP